MKIREHGFTLLEMLVYVAILTMVVGVVVSMLLWVIRSNTSVQATRAVTENAQSALSVMGNEMREASSVYTPTTTATQVSLETAKNLPADETSTYIDFFLCGTRICLRREAQNPVAITSENVEVTSLQFAQVETGAIPSVEVHMTIEYPNPNNRVELNASISPQETFSLRSY